VAHACTPGLRAAEENVCPPPGRVPLKGSERGRGDVLAAQTWWRGPSFLATSRP
jgi:hypothetical protein